MAADEDTSGYGFDKDPMVDVFRAGRPDASFRPGDETPGGAADGETDAFERDGAGPPGPPAEGAWSEEPRASGCLIMGPGRAGKTTLIAAIDQACNQPGRAPDRPDLEFVGGPEIGELTARAVQQILEGEITIEGTTDPERYEFSVSTRPSGRRGILASTQFSIIDGAGGTLFPKRADLLLAHPESWERDLIEAGREAGALVLCLDPNDELHCALTHRYISGLLGHLVSEYWLYDERPVSWRRRALAVLGIGGAPPPQWVRKLKAKRFLLLFTKVDLLVSQILSESERSDGSLAPDCSPRAIAAQLDPVAQACELLGEVALRRLDAALPPGAQFAVGFCSNWGFDPTTGDPFMPDGRAVRRLYGMSRERRPADWTPFGVREAVDFLVTGAASPPVRLIDRARLVAEPRTRALATRIRSDR